MTRPEQQLSGAGEEKRKVKEQNKITIFQGYAKGKHLRTKVFNFQFAWGGPRQSLENVVCQICEASKEDF